MIIYINSRKVDAHRLKIYAQQTEVANLLMFSDPKGKVDIGNFNGDCLRFEWDFNLSKDEKKELKEREDCPEWGLDSYDLGKQGIFGTSGFDWIDGSSCPIETRGIYNTVVRNIPETFKELHLIFRRTKFCEDYSILDIMNREEDKIVDVTFEKSKNSDIVIEKAKESMRKKTLKTIIGICVLIVLFLFLEKIQAKKYWIFPLLFLIIAFVENIHKKNKAYNKFLSRAVRLKAFKEVDGKIIEL